MPEQSQQATLRSLGDERLREIVERYSRSARARRRRSGARAADRGRDLVHASAAELVSRSRGDRRLPAQGTEHRSLAPRFDDAPTGSSPSAGYIWDEERACYGAFVLDVLTLRGGQIAEVTAFIDRTIFARFGLPDELPA